MWEFDGLPLHPLVVHAPVVLIPLLAAGLALFVFWPSSRRTLGPILAGVAVGAALTTVLAVASGEQLVEDLGRGNTAARHAARGELARLLTILLAGGTVMVMVLDRLATRGRIRSSNTPGLLVATGAVLTTVVVGLAGHSGAELAWEGKLSTRDPVVNPATTVPDEGTDVVADVVTTEAGDDPGASVPESDPVIDVILGEWALITSVDEAPPGPITFRIRNAGTHVHAFRIRTPGSGRDRLEWRSAAVAPGDELLMTVDLFEGSFELTCPVDDGAGDHDDLGMEAPFAVRADAPPLVASPAAPTDTAEGAESLPTDGAEVPGVVSVDIDGFAYDPATVTVPVGTTVSWTNRDPAPHTATGNGFDTGTLATGGSATVAFDEPGVFDYICTIHPSMSAQVVVEG